MNPLPLWVLFFFVVLPLVEMVILIWLGTHIGLWPTLGIVVGTGILGGILVREQGPRAWWEIVGAWREGRVPSNELVAGALFLVGAAFLLTPGVLTDVTGFMLMLPPVRGSLARRIVDRFRIRATTKVDSYVVGVRRVP